MILASVLAAGLWVGAYQDVSLGWRPDTRQLAHAAWLGPPQPGRVRVLAFATGTCGDERWGDGIDTEAFAAQVRELTHDYLISTGGEAGGFECDSDAGWQRFLNRYASPRLVGVDFDIERQQTPAQIDALVQRARWTHEHHPRLRLSFTLATFAASDGSQRNLNATGETVLAALARHGLQDKAVINLMAMNYGPATAANCVVQAGRCDMGASALQAVRNLHAARGIPYAQLALTLMPGENDVEGNVLTLDDAERVAQGARELGLAGLHWWSLDRDQPCPAKTPRVSPLCHGLPAVSAGSFARRWGALR